MIPVCCGQEAKWVVNGRDLQYWYCRECKEEVLELPTSAATGCVYGGLQFLTGGGVYPAVPTNCAMGNHPWDAATDCCALCGANHLDVLTAALGKGIP